MTFFQILSILAQFAMLLVIVHLAAAGGRTIFQRFFNPGCWYMLFYCLWFLIPQMVSLGNDDFVLGYPGATKKLVMRSQFYLVGFNAVVMMGLLAVRLLFDFRTGSVPLKLHFEELYAREKVLLFGFYSAGCLATLYLGTQLMNSEGMRSELVKSPLGLVATLVSFFGVFAMAVFLGHGMYERRYLMAGFAALTMGGAIFFTGARGRLLWPISLAVSYTLCRANRIRIRHIVAMVVLSVLVLLVFDPVLAALRDGLRHFSFRDIQERVMLSNLFMTKRNFDGFANFTVIVSQNSLPPDPIIFLKGGRTAFMEHYFPGMLEKGVGFGTTVPGMLWLGGGLAGLLVGGFSYGAILGLLALWVRQIRHEPMYWSYMFAMTWIAAIGGNFQESLDKMVAIALPGFVWLALFPYRRAKRASDFAGGTIVGAQPE